ncbi:MAG: deoxyribose-phosphate aldolase [Bacillota bacterium]|nr:deoxyribose-phosphate aldolase [Bacillota bacterium]
MKLNKYIDHTLLKPEASEAQILKLCDEALEYDFYSVCVNGCHVPLAVSKLEGSDVKVAAVVGFPLGAMSTAAKVFETREAVDAGASEIDMVINVGALKEGRYEYVLSEISALADTCPCLKVIIETCLLTDEEIVKACELAVEAGADFVKTSTGFSTGGATEEAVVLMRRTVGDKAKIKASGGIRTLADAQKFIELGADRLGCSAGVQIMKETVTTTC